MAFESRASNLVPDDTTDLFTDVFLRDTQEGTTIRVSVSTGEEEGNGASTLAAVISSGPLVAYQSVATNLVDTDTNGNTDVFLHNLSPDTDGDGIFDGVDGYCTEVPCEEEDFVDESSLSPDSFTDQHLGGTSFGTIVDRADLTFTIQDAPEAGDGLLLEASGGAGTAEVDACDFTMFLDSGDSAVVTCESLLLEVLVGPVAVSLDSAFTVIVPEDTIVEVTETGEGQWEVVNSALSLGTVSVDDGESVTPIPPGTSLLVTLNEPPVADAGPDQPAVEWTAGGASATLDGSGSSDPDDDPLTYTWTGPFSEGGGTVTGVSPTVTLPSLGSFDITLTVDDGNGETDDDTVTITVVDTTPPEVTAAFVPVGDIEEDEGRFRIEYSCSDTCDPDPQTTGVLVTPPPGRTRHQTQDQVQGENQVRLGKR